MDWLRQILNQAFAAFKAMTAAQRASMAMLAVVIAVTLGLVAFLGARPKYVTLVGNLDQGEIAEVTEFLDGRGEEYKVDPAKGAVLVHQDRRPSLHKEMVRGKIIPQKLLDNAWYVGQGSVTTSQRERRHLRKIALEAELVKMLTELEGIEGASVNITGSSGSEWAWEKPEAIGVAVAVTSRRSAKMDQAFANSIIDLVDSAVRHSDPQKISVVDTRTPRRMYHKEDPDSVLVIGKRRLDLTRAVEGYFRQQIEEFIRKTGYEAAVKVVVVLDLKRIKESAYKVLGEESVQVSYAKRKSIHTGAVGPSGPVGTNQQIPPGGGVLPSGVTSGGGRSGRPSESKEDELEFAQDCSRILTETVGTPGTIKKLSLSVMLFHRVVQQKDKETGTLKEVYEAPTPEEKKNWNDLLTNMVSVVEEAREGAAGAVGAAGAAGAVKVVVAYMKPDRPDPLAFVETPKNWQDRVKDYAPAARIGGLFLLATFALFFLYGLGKRAATTRPVMTAPGAKAGPAAREEVELEPPPPEDVEFHEIQRRIRSFVESDPRKVAGLVKRWLVRES